MKTDYKVISAHLHRCGETPMWDDRKKQFWWSDMLAGELYRYDPKTGEVALAGKGNHVSGFTMNEPGGLVCATHEGLCLFDEQRGFTLLADSFAGQPLRSNDATADARGRFIFGTTFYDADKDPGGYMLGRIYSVDTDGTIRILDEGFHMTNGIGFSPDDRTIYITETVKRVIYAYDYDIETGAVSNKRDFIKVPDTQGIPDGMTVDAQGGIWSAQWYGSCIMHYDANGKFLEKIDTPEPQTSSLVFGGADMTDVLVTTAGTCAYLPFKPVGYDYDANTKYLGGKILMYNFGVKGRPENFANITAAAFAGGAKGE